MPIIRTKGQDAPEVGSDAIPFVPAYDLLEAKKAALSDEEVAAVAVSLLHFTRKNRASSSSSDWSAAAKFEAVYQTTLKG